MKKPAQSRAVLSEMMLPCQANPAGKVHGGEIMKFMDNCGGVCAMRHAKTQVVTVRVDELVFHQPIFVGELVTCKAELVFAGKTSMEVKVTVEVEDLMAESAPRTALTAFFTYVALDEEGRPKAVPKLLVETAQEKAAFQEGERRYLAYKKGRN